MSGIGTAGQTH